MVQTKQQTGLNGYCKQYIQHIDNHHELELLYNEVEDKIFKIDDYNDESGGKHPNNKTWTNLYEMICEKVNEFRNKKPSKR